MITRTLKSMLENEFDMVQWTRNFAPENLHDVVTIYYEGGREPSHYDDEMRRPMYMIFIKNTDYELAEALAQKIFDYIKTVKPFYADESYKGLDKVYRVYGLYPSEPNRLGVNVDIDTMEYTINVQAYLIEHQGAI